jgi:hypothetical protein
MFVISLKPIHEGCSLLFIYTKMEESMRTLGVVGCAYKKLANDLNNIATDYAQQAMTLRAAVYYSQLTHKTPPIDRGGGKEKREPKKKRKLPPATDDDQQVCKRTRTTFHNPHPHTNRLQTSYKDPD